MYTSPGIRLISMHVSSKQGVEDMIALGDLREAEILIIFVYNFQFTRAVKKYINCRQFMKEN
jgi:hypothetical protein